MPPHLEPGGQGTGLTPAASKGLKLYEVDVPEPMPAPQSDLFDNPSLRFLRLIPDFPVSDVEERPEEIGGPIGFIYRPSWKSPPT